MGQHWHPLRLEGSARYHHSASHSALEIKGRHCYQNWCSPCGPSKSSQNSNTYSRDILYQLVSQTPRHTIHIVRLLVAQKFSKSVHFGIVYVWIRQHGNTRGQKDKEKRPKVCPFARRYVTCYLHCLRLLSIKESWVSKSKGSLLQRTRVGAVNQNDINKLKEKIFSQNSGGAHSPRAHAWEDWNLHPKLTVDHTQGLLWSHLSCSTSMDWNCRSSLRKAASSPTCNDLKY